MGEETVHRRKSWRGFFARRSFRVFMRRANARYSSKRRSNIHTLFVVLDRWRPGFSRLEGEEFGRSTSKEIEQGEIRARAFFASNRPLNDRERRFLLRDLLPFSLSARHDFSFPLSLSRLIFASLSPPLPFSPLSISTTCSTSTRHEGTMRQFEKERGRSSFSLKRYKRSAVYSDYEAREGKGGGWHMFLLLRKTCQQKLDRYHRFFVPFLSRGEGMVVYGRRAHFKEASANANRFNRRSRREREKGGEKKRKKGGKSTSSRILQRGGGGGGGKSEIK